MSDFLPDEKLYITGLDPNDANRRIGAIFIKADKNGVTVGLVNKAVRTVPLSAVHKTTAQQDAAANW